jgi:hypothetical protein
MSEQATQPEHFPPIAEGVQHGPYPHDGTPFSQTNGLSKAVDEAMATKPISLEMEQKIGDLSWTEYRDDEEAKDRLQQEELAKYDQAVADFVGVHPSDLRPHDYDAYEENEIKLMQSDEHEQKDDDEDKGDETDYLYQEEEDNEDPLAGDVDRFVHPDETRSNAQIDHDRKYAVEPYDDTEADHLRRNDPEHQSR